MTLPNAYDLCEAEQIEDSSSFLSVDPPRIEAAKLIEPELMWQTAINWVNEKPRLIGKIAGRDGSNLMEQDDLIQKAYIVAYETLSHCRQDGTLENFVKRFISAFKKTIHFEFLRSCRQHICFFSSCEFVEGSFEVNQFNFIASRRSHLQDPETRIIDLEDEAEANEAILQSLTFMTNRQKKFWEILFFQDSVHGVKTIHAACVCNGVKEKKGRELFSRSIKRVRRAVC